ncbi:hypothetical protein [Paraoerskovia marina]|uniref:hypothetical protein n=1 Tax=Paraoerskovia marina TaxID=545619 RepID=UPI0012FAD2F5|nr:hypothetical protein [Paraoerskovia marina]
MTLGRPATAVVAAIVTITTVGITSAAATNAHVHVVGGTITGPTNGVSTARIYPKGTTTYRIRAPYYRDVSPTFTVTQGVSMGVPSSFTIKGSGCGHGVGMPQYGAYAQALAGRPASTILKHYYQGADVSWRTTESNVAVQVFGPEPYGYAKGSYSDEKSSTLTTVSGGT